MDGIRSEGRDSREAKSWKLEQGKCFLSVGGIIGNIQAGRLEPVDLEKFGHWYSLDQWGLLGAT